MERVAGSGAFAEGAKFVFDVLLFGGAVFYACLDCFAIRVMLNVDFYASDAIGFKRAGGEGK